MCVIFPVVEITHSVLADVLWKFYNYKKTSPLQGNL